MRGTLRRISILLSPQTWGLINCALVRIIGVQSLKVFLSRIHVTY
jgi:hypothetical protein